MKLILKQYLASLNERDELDAILPDLLSQMGWNVFSKPRRGTKQYGVDVAAIGKDKKGVEVVYLFSVKSGDLTRSTWSGNPQTLRPSLEQILDFYIPTCIPVEHRSKRVVICMCFGGVIQEPVRGEVEGFIDRNSTNHISFQEWNGDVLADLIIDNFLNEKLLPNEVQSDLRKSLALLDEPEASFRHFSKLVKALSSANYRDKKSRNRAIRQLNICLWILYAWARDQDNLESPYLASEIVLLNCWELSKTDILKAIDSNRENIIRDSFESVLITYLSILYQYADKIKSSVSINHALSSAVTSFSSVDVNLKMFDILGRLAIAGLWAFYFSEKDKLSNSLVVEMKDISDSILLLIKNNPTLLSPLKDSQAIDISLAILYLQLDSNNSEFIISWLNEILNRSIFSYRTNCKYPCNLEPYRKLIEHPKIGIDDYKEEVTASSILYPTIALWAGILRDDDLYLQVQEAKLNYFQHCNFQMWYPDEKTEEHLYLNSDLHGAVVVNVPVDKTSDEYLSLLFGECEQNNHFKRLSCNEIGFFPVVLVACRQYRLPLPVHFICDPSRMNKKIQSSKILPRKRVQSSWIRWRHFRKRKKNRRKSFAIKRKR